MNSNRPKVSVIVATKNSAATIGACLESIKSQDYPNIEIIVVDNFSQDNTLSIAKQTTDLAYSHGPERSYQRNFGVRKATGEYVLVVDSDMELTNEVVTRCVKKMHMDSNIKAIVIPEASFGIGFWAKCKVLERSFYIGVDWLEAARFFREQIFVEMGGYDEQNTGTEDYDLPARIVLAYGDKSIGRVDGQIMHNEQRINLRKTIKKKFYYAQMLDSYKSTEANKLNFNKQSNLFLRYQLFFKNPGKLLKNPHIGLGMLFMKTVEMFAGLLGYISYKIKQFHI